MGFESNKTAVAMMRRAVVAEERESGRRWSKRMEWAGRGGEELSATYVTIVGSAISP